MDRTLIFFIIAVILAVIFNQGCPEGTHTESVYSMRSVSSVCVP